MATNNEFQIIELCRTLHSDVEERIVFKPGINLIEGGPNTGKTTWLQCLNYLLGAERPVEHYFSDKFIQKYRSIKGKFITCTKKFEIERDWTIPRKKSKIKYNGQTKSSDEFQRDILNYLNIPILKYPKTDPISEIKATSLSFRMHFRHLYRQQRFWNDLVDKQPSGEFRSCLLNFIGLAEYIYTDNYYKFYEISEKLKNANELFASNKEILDIIFSKVLQSYKLANNVTDPNFYSRVINNEEDNLKKINSQLKDEINKISKRITKSILEKNESDYFKVLKEYSRLQKEIGRLEERVKILKNLEPIINAAIDSHLLKNKLTEQIQPYYEHIRQLGNTVDLNSRIELLCDSINQYLSQLNAIRTNTWRHRTVNMVVNRNFVDVRIGTRPWNNVLGGTDSLYFFLAYHYGLLAISSLSISRVPSFIVIDFPPDIQGEEINDNQSLTIKPFINLVNQKSHSHCQIIFSGHTFKSLKDCHLIRMENEYLG